MGQPFNRIEGLYELKIGSNEEVPLKKPKQEKKIKTVGDNIAEQFAIITRCEHGSKERGVAFEKVNDLFETRREDAKSSGNKDILDESEEFLKKFKAIVYERLRELSTGEKAAEAEEKLQTGLASLQEKIKSSLLKEKELEKTNVEIKGKAEEGVLEEVVIAKENPGEKKYFEEFDVENIVANHKNNLEKIISPKNRENYISEILKKAADIIDKKPEYYDALEKMVVEYLASVKEKEEPTIKPTPELPPKPPVYDPEIIKLPSPPIYDKDVVITLPPKPEDKSETKTFSIDFIIERVRTFLASNKNIREVKNLEVKGSGNEITLNLKVLAGPLGSEVGVQAVLESKGGNIKVKSHKIEAGWMIKGTVEGILVPKLNEVSELLKSYIEKSEKRKVEKMEVENGTLVVTFIAGKAETPPAQKPAWSQEMIKLPPKPYDESEINKPAPEITFKYRALNSSGKEIEGTIKALDLDDAKDKIRAAKLLPDLVEESKNEPTRENRAGKIAELRKRIEELDQQIKEGEKTRETIIKRLAEIRAKSAQ